MIYYSCMQSIDFYILAIIVIVVYILLNLTIRLPEAKTSTGIYNCFLYISTRETQLVCF